MINRAWLTTCVSSFLIQFAVFGLHNNFGIIFHELIKVFQQSRAATAWIGSLAMGTTFLISPFSNLLMSYVGYRKMLSLACLLCTVSLLTSSFVSDVYLLSFTYSVLFGFGAGIANHASLVSLQVNAKEKLSLANGVSSSGSGIGTFALGPILTYLIKNYDFRWSFRAIIVLPILFLPSILLTKDFKSSDCDESTDEDTFKNNVEVSKQNVDKKVLINRTYSVEYLNGDLPDHTNDDVMNHLNNNNNNTSDNTSRELKPDKNCLNQLIDKEIWKHLPYVVFIAGFSTFLFGYFIPFVFLVEHAHSFDIPMSTAQFLIGILAIVATIVKILGGIFLDVQQRIDRSTLFLISMFSMSLSQLLAAYATQYYQFVMFSVIFGIFEGILIGQIPTVVLDVIPQKEKIGVALANLFAVMSLPIMVGPVVAGNLSGSSNSYSTPFIAAAGVSFLGAVITSMGKLFKKKTSIIHSTKDHILWNGTSKPDNPIFVSTSICSVTFTGFTRSSKYKQNLVHT